MSSNHPAKTSQSAGQRVRLSLAPAGPSGFALLEAVLDDLDRPADQLPAALEAVCAHLVVAQGGGQAAIWLRSSGSGFRAVPASFDQAWDLAFLNAGYGVCTDADPIASTYERGEVLVVDDASLDPRFASLGRQAERLGFRSAAFVPLAWQGRTLGVLALHDEHPRRYSVDDLRGVKAVARQLALALGTCAVAEPAEHSPREQDLEQKLRDAQQVAELKDTFTAMLSHELRTPINVIMGFGSILEDGVAGPLNEQQGQYVQRIMGAAEILLGLIGDLLDESRIRAGQFIVQRAPTEVAAVLSEVVEGLMPLAQKRGQSVSLDVEEGLRPLMADAQRLSQALTNLMANAIKFTPNGGAIALSACTRGPMLRFEVRDNGPGIAHADAAKLFARFVQMTHDRTDPRRGTGLGLAIAKTIVEAHGGTIGVESEPGLGSTFWFELPTAS